MYIIIFIIILAVLVFVHELGHFLAAKAAGIRVDEFAIGFPPRLFGFTKGETKYSINLIPFGGYVKIFGEDYEDDTPPAVEGTEMKGTESVDDRSFIQKPRYIQAGVLLAGILFNILFAWILLSLSFMVGMPAPEGYQGPGVVQNTITTITSVQKNSPAEKAGFQPGDHIVSMSALDQTIQNPSSADTQTFTASHKDIPITVVYQRHNATSTTTVTPTVSSGDHATIGISMEALGMLRLGIVPSIIEGAKLTANIVWLTALGLRDFIVNIFRGHAHVADVTGPVGIASLVNDATKLGFSYILSFTAFISINLAVINFIPFPALDGGRVLFVILEKIRGKALNKKVVQIVNTTGLALLLLLMLVVTYHDIAKLFVK